MKKTFEFKITPLEAAEAFAAMDNEEQAEFFNGVACCVSKTYTHRNIDTQIAWILDSKILSAAGRAIMKSIGQ